MTIHDLDRLRRAGGGALRLLVDLLPVDLHTDRSDADAEEEVCIVFADVADYSDFVAGAGDDAAMTVLEILDELVAQALEGSHARVVKRLGDGLMIACHDPYEALDIAVALVDGFASRTEAIGWPLTLRAGVHRGTCRRRDGDYFGYNVNLAARVATSARAGAVLATAHAVAGVDLPSLALRGSGAGTLRAKGVNGAVSLFRIERVPASIDKGNARAGLRIPLIGRLPRIPGVPSGLRWVERCADAG